MHLSFTGSGLWSIEYHTWSHSLDSELIELLVGLLELVEVRDELDHELLLDDPLELELELDVLEVLVDELVNDSVTELKVDALDVLFDRLLSDWELDVSVEELLIKSPGIHGCSAPRAHPGSVPR